MSLGGELPQVPLCATGCVRRMDRFNGNSWGRIVHRLRYRQLALLALLVKWIQSSPMTLTFSGLGVMHRVLAGMLLTTALVACEKDEPAQPAIIRLCPVEWRGTLTTDWNEFNVRACWNGNCTSNMPMQAAQNDGGMAQAFPDAGCVPTTPGGLPSRCALVPITPGPGCAVGEIGTYFAVSACAESDREQTTFNVVLTPSTEGYPDGGDRVGLTIETATGNALVDATADLGSDDDLNTDNSISCRGGLFGLNGTPITE